MNIYAVGPFINSILFFLLALIVWIKKRNTLIGRLFVLCCSLTFYWQISWTILFSIKDPHLASILVRVGYSGIIFLPMAFYHFIVILTRSDREKTFIKPFYILGFIFLVLLWTTNLFIQGYYKYSWGYYPRASLVMHPVYMATVSYVIFRIYVSLYKYYETRKDYSSRNQVKYLMLSFMIYCFAASDYLVNYGMGFYPFGFIPTTIASFLLAYAIFRLHLFDLNIVFRKITGYSLAIATLSVLFVIILFFLSALFGFALAKQNIWGMLFIVTALAIAFQPVLRWSTIRVDRLFFKGSLPEVSEQKERIEEELKQEQEQAMKNRISVITSMASGFADRLGNNLTSLKTFFDNVFPERMKEIAGETKSEARDSLESFAGVTNSSVDKLIALNNLMRDFCQPPGLVFKKYEHKVIMDIVDEAKNELKSDMSNKEIQIEKFIEGTPPVVFFDRKTIKQTMRHLIQNSIHAIPETRKGRILVKITGPVKRNEKEFLRIVVEDNGQGIQEKHREDIFNPFMTTKGTVGGLGLGLVICQFIVSQHEGKIELAKSDVEEGTTFHIDLPVKDTPPEALPDYRDLLKEFRKR